MLQLMSCVHSITYLANEQTVLERTDLLIIDVAESIGRNLEGAWFKKFLSILNNVRHNIQWYLITKCKLFRAVFLQRNHWKFTVALTDWFSKEKGGLVSSNHIISPDSFPETVILLRVAVNILYSTKTLGVE